jgi:hypothetical protein
MDFNNLKKSVANLSLYDIKAGVRQLQNGMLNCDLVITEMSDLSQSRHELHGNGIEGQRGYQ